MKRYVFRDLFDLSPGPIHTPPQEYIVVISGTKMNENCIYGIQRFRIADNAV